MGVCISNNNEVKIAEICISNNNEVNIAEINIIYNVDNRKCIELFGHKFVENNKNICKMIIDNK